MQAEESLLYRNCRGVDPKARDTPVWHSAQAPWMCTCVTELTGSVPQLDLQAELALALPHLTWIMA